MPPAPGASYARYDSAFLQVVSPKPVRRFPVVIPCPDLGCPDLNHEWLCSRCFGLIEYCEHYLYCNCGSCKYTEWEWQCSNVKDGQFAKYPNPKLFRRLLHLEPNEPLNILILGTRGVGKSTWINALLSYFSFETLDEAAAATDFPWHIPFAFSVHNVRDDGEFEQVKVSYGFENPIGSNWEQDDGESGPQDASVVPIQWGQRLIRLINTPGIGDTRGTPQEKKNLAEMFLRALGIYDKIHGVLVLLKANEQQLGPMFRFSIQELLTHLHRDAVKNIAFGFTNTRATGYVPGDTFGALGTLLQQFENLDLRLHNQNVYCFDSESFRYLAAQKQGKFLGHMKQVRRSWDHSANESLRLIDHFRSVPPHEVDATKNLYETRCRIIQMTGPLAELAKTIGNTIRAQEADVEKLELMKLPKKDLEGMAKVPKNSLRMTPSPKPWTTCSHTNCIAYKPSDATGSDGKPVLNLVYKSKCHRPCHLETGWVPVHEVGAGRLKCCAAFIKDGGEKCGICGHPWKTHLHIQYQYTETVDKVDDPGITEVLKSDATLSQKQQAVTDIKKGLLEELADELKTVREVAARFSIFLSDNGISPTNDATVGYLDAQIEEEEGKVAAGGSTDKVKSLLEHRRQYLRVVDVLRESLPFGENLKWLTPDGITEEFAFLGTLKHYGEQFMELKETLLPSQEGEEGGEDEGGDPTSAEGRHWHGIIPPKSPRPKSPRPKSPRALGLALRTWILRGFN